MKVLYTKLSKLRKNWGNSIKKLVEKYKEGQIYWERNRYRLPEPVKKILDLFYDVTAIVAAAVCLTLVRVAIEISNFNSAFVNLIAEVYGNRFELKQPFPSY